MTSRTSDKCIDPISPGDVLGMRYFPVNGTCCACGFKGKRETKCKQRDDHKHCEHWYDGPDMEGAK